MAKTSDWKIVATEGATVDGRAITANWIKEMAEAYSHDEYSALIWPEHQRSNWGKFEGNNWGIVEQLKAEKRGGKLRLFAKITPNTHLLKANANEQKLFTSIEPNPDYKGQGTCYLMGLAVTDSPASTGTTRLKFSTGSGDEKNIECSQLEEIEFSECFSQQNPITKAIATLAQYFQSGGSLPEVQTTPEPEETDVTKEELAQEMQTHFSEFKTDLLTELDQKFSQKESAPETEVPAEEPQQFSAEQFSSELAKQLKPLTEKVNGLETKFNDLSKEVPGQRPGNEGAGETQVEVI
ncbi:GPO family capsid scaffolding protein [Psychromonas ossibalaenae]|uniref:GPO family capsid scaffolding protein n=1 Tax=Psychromonas ossibalaenae TaxID=444922 RepID=UPI00035C7013|nr:GPO family capsid scaffolding protein [Psychromonas ossibalaenae]